jgi:hypothetical protein
LDATKSGFSPPHGSAYVHISQQIIPNLNQIRIAIYNETFPSSADKREKIPVNISLLVIFLSTKNLRCHIRTGTLVW